MAAGLSAAGAPAAAPSGFSAASSNSKKGFPTSTVSPSPANNYVMAPATGDLISTYTLSVSIIAKVSS